MADFLGRIDGVSDAAALAHRVMGALPGLIPSDLTVWTEMDPGRARFSWAHDVDHFAFSGISGIFERHMRQHPLATHFRRTGDGSAFKFSDFLTRRQLHRQPFYDEIYRRFGCEHSIAIWLRGSALPVSAFALHRARRDFSERERLLLNVARAHVVAIQRTLSEVSRVRHELAALHHGLEAVDQGIVLLTDEGQVLHATRRARAWFADYFPGGRPTDHLPSLVGDWLRRQGQRPQADGQAPLPRTPLVIERDGKQLILRLHSQPSERVLLLEERWQGAAPLALKTLGLSPREAQTLTWVIAGKTNAEVGTILGISPRTVQTHLDRIYRKLDVDSRVAAVACALTRRSG